MRDTVKAGLAIMRDPDTCQTTGIIRHINDDGTVCLCALGCIAQAVVDAGLDSWSIHDPSLLTNCVNGRYDGSAYGLALGEVDEMAGSASIITMNDDKLLPLSEIADFIESKYKEREGTNAGL